MKINAGRIQKGEHILNLTQKPDFPVEFQPGFFCFVTQKRLGKSVKNWLFIIT